MLIVSPLVKMHICKRAKEHNIKYINGMEDVLQKFIQMPQMNGYNLAFLYMQSDGRRVLQASAAIPKTITSSAEWAAVLVVNYSATSYRASETVSAPEGRSGIFFYSCLTG